MKNALTATKIEKYRPSKDDELVSDGNSLYLRFRKNVGGDLSRTFLYSYRRGSRSHYITLGGYMDRLTASDVELYKLNDDVLTLAAAPERVNDFETPE